MGWILILVRTLPFWAIPLGIGLIIDSFRNNRKGQPKSGTMKFLLIFLGALLLGLSVIFLLNQGHNTAVPFVHEIFKEAFR